MWETSGFLTGDNSRLMLVDSKFPDCCGHALTLFVYYGDSNFLTMSLLKALDNSQLCSAYVGHNLLITRFKILLSQALVPCMQFPGS